MDKAKRFEPIHTAGKFTYSAQWYKLRFSSVKQTVEDLDKDQASSGYTGYVKTRKPSKRERTQPKKTSYIGGKGEKRIRQLRQRSHKRDDSLL